MKRIVLPVLFLFCSLSFIAAEKIYVPVHMDAAIFLSYGVYPNSSDDELTLDDLDLFFKSLRGGISLTARYEFNSMFSAGLESGVATVTYDNTTYIDVPLNVLARFGYENLFAEPHLGAYFSSFSELSGVSAGAKFALNNWFFDASLILAEQTYTRYTLGFQVNNFI